MTKNEVMVKIGVALGATPLTFGFMQASEHGRSWKPLIDTGIVGLVCIASFWTIWHLIDKLTEQAHLNQVKIDAIITQHKADMEAGRADMRALLDKLLPK